MLARALELVPADVPVLALPMQSVGLSVEHVRFPGTLTLSAETLIAVLTEIGRSVARAGPRRLVDLNSHGGQPQVVDIVCRRLRGDGMFAVSCMASRWDFRRASLSRGRAQPTASTAVWWRPVSCCISVPTWCGQAGQSASAAPG